MGQFFQHVVVILPFSNPKTTTGLNGKCHERIDATKLMILRSGLCAPSYKKCCVPASNSIRPWILTWATLGDINILPKPRLFSTVTICKTVLNWCLVSTRHDNFNPSNWSAFKIRPPLGDDCTIVITGFGFGFQIAPTSPYRATSGTLQYLGRSNWRYLLLAWWRRPYLERFKQVVTQQANVIYEILVRPLLMAFQSR